MRTPRCAHKAHSPHISTSRRTPSAASTYGHSTAPRPHPNVRTLALFWPRVEDTLARPPSHTAAVHGPLRCAGIRSGFPHSVLSPESSAMPAFPLRPLRRLHPHRPRPGPRRHQGQHRPHQPPPGRTHPQRRQHPPPSRRRDPLPHAARPPIRRPLAQHPPPIRVGRRSTTFALVGGREKWHRRSAGDDEGSVLYFTFPASSSSDTQRRDAPPSTRTCRSSISTTGGRGEWHRGAWHSDDEGGSVFYLIYPASSSYGAHQHGRLLSTRRHPLICFSPVLHPRAEITVSPYHRLTSPRSSSFPSLRRLPPRRVPQPRDRRSRPARRPPHQRPPGRGLRHRHRPRIHGRR